MKLKFKQLELTIHQSYVKKNNRIMMKILTIILFAFQVWSISATEIRIDYIGPNCFEQLFSIDDFYRVWNFQGDMVEKYSCCLYDNYLVEEIENYLYSKEPSDDLYVFPIAIITIYTDENNSKRFEVGLRRLKLEGDEKVYKVPRELWNLLGEYLPYKKLFDYYSDVIFNRNIKGYGDYHYTD